MIDPRIIKENPERVLKMLNDRNVNISIEDIKNGNYNMEYK